MVVLSALIVLFIAFCIEGYYSSTRKGPWYKPQEPPQQNSKPLELTFPPAVVVDAVPRIPEPRKETVKVSKKSLCRRCAFLENGDCVRGVSGAPNVFSCKIHISKKSPQGRQVKKELRELREQSAACSLGDNLSSPQTTISVDKLDRSEIILFDMKD